MASITINFIIVIICLLSCKKIESADPSDCKQTLQFTAGSGHPIITCYDVSQDLIIDYAYDGLVEVLVIRESEISTVPANNSLKDFKGIKDLRMAALNIKNVMPKAFQGLEGLENLNLNRNQLEELRNDTFKYLNSLKTLSCSQNIIRKIDPKTFTNLTNLEVLYLNYNNLSTLPTNLFSWNLTRLRYIDISNNPLKNIPDIKSLPNFGNLVAQNMKLMKFDIDISNLSVSEINLSGNQLKTVNFTLFPNATALDLSRNDLIEIRGWQDLNCSNLYLNENELKPDLDEISVLVKTIDLSNNPIEFLINLRNDRDKNLEILALVKSSIWNLEHDAFSGMSRLKFLNLAQNNLTFIEHDPFYNLSLLEKLDLSHNKLEFIKETSFVNNTNLQELFLSNNNLNYLQPDLFYSLNKLRVLRFSYNSIIRFDFKDVINHLTSLTDLGINHNQWICADLLEKFVFFSKKISLDTVRSTQSTINGIYCNHFTKES